MRQEHAIMAAAAVHDPIRRRLFEMVAASSDPVSRDAAATLMGVPRSTAAFHLDRLADAGLLLVEYGRPDGRTGGPGSGRPSKLYRASAAEFSVSFPERHYDLMGDLLASAIESAAPDEPAADSLRRVAIEAGRRAGEAAGTFDQVLEQTGYDAVEEDDEIVLANCPFHRLAASHTDVVCAANLAFLRGAAQATDVDPQLVQLSPSPGRCCVSVRRE